MRILIILVSFLLLEGCQKKSGEEVSIQKSHEILNVTPYEADSMIFFSRKSYPLRLSLDKNFTENEQKIIEDAQASWEKVSSFNTDIFNEQNSYYVDQPRTDDLNNFDDDILGVYKLESWPKELKSAMAAVQIYGIRTRFISENGNLEKVVILNADIFLNFGNGGISSSNELKKLVVRSLGSFLGVPQNNIDNDSVMNYCSSGEVITHKDASNLYHLLKEGIEFDAVNEKPLSYIREAEKFTVLIK